MKSLRLGLTAAAFLFLPHAVFANPINPVSYASLTGTGLVTFDDVTGGADPGTSYDGILASGGEHFAERFVGQTVTTNSTAGGDFDSLSGAPTGPLALQVGASGQNVNLVEFLGTNVLDGLGPVGFPSSEAIGEGSFAVLFTNDQSQFGFQFAGGENDPTTGATLDFFRRDGSLIERIVVFNVPALGAQGFSREGGVQDIAGVSIFNNEGGGIAVDNIKFDVPSTPVPEPGTLGLLGIGGLFLLRRRNRSK